MNEKQAVDAARSATRPFGTAQGKPDPSAPLRVDPTSRQPFDTAQRKKGTRAKEAATQVGGGLANQINSASDKLAHNTLKAIAVQTEAKVNHALETGEFLQYFDGLFTNLDVGLNSAIETEYLMLEVLNESPKALLPEGSNGFSSSN